MSEVASFFLPLFLFRFFLPFFLFFFLGLPRPTAASSSKAIPRNKVWLKVDVWLKAKVEMEMLGLIVVETIERERMEMEKEAQARLPSNTAFIFKNVAF